MRFQAMRAALRPEKIQMNPCFPLSVRIRPARLGLRQKSEKRTQQEDSQSTPHALPLKHKVEHVSNQQNAAGHDADKGGDQRNPQHLAQNDHLGQ